MGPASTKDTVEDRGAGTSGEDLAMVGDPPPSQDVSAAGVHGTNEKPGSDTLGQRSLLQAVLNFFLPPSSDSTGELKPKYQKLKTENSHLKVQNGQLWAENEALKSQLGKFNRVLESKERAHNIKLGEVRAQLVQNEVELAEMKTTLCMHDDCSETDITNMVESINTKIRFFGSVAKQWIKDASNPSDGGSDQQPVTEEEAAKLSEVIGVHLVNVLRNSTPGQSKNAVVFLRVAWRACVVSTVTKILSSFSAPLAGTAEGLHIDATLQSISGKVMDGESQPAYGRWRYITHRYLKQVYPDEKEALQFYGKEALGHCRTASRLVMKTRCPDDHVLTTNFEMKLEEIMADAFKLLTTFQEKWTTKNFEPYTPKEGDRFSAEAMEVGKQDKNFDNDKVACIIGLGLLYWGKEGRENTSATPDKYIFKKVQVFTENNLHEMFAGA